MSGFLRHGHEVTESIVESCDVCVVGSGAGGAVLAAGLVQMGLDVVMLEAGPAVSREDFSLHERDAYPNLYQERGGRATDDLAITILQGRTVGGSTTVNWTTCYRTPERILNHWARVHGVKGLSTADLSPHFDAVEKRLNIHAWSEALANPNNRTLLDGARALGWEAHATHRNVKGCANSGFCGLGCPVNGKQAMHLTYLQDALAGGLRLYADVHADQIRTESGKATGVEGVILRRGTSQRSGLTVSVNATVVVAAGGAINSPALLLRSGLNPNARVGRRTWLHPVVGVTGQYKDAINGFYGAPQSAASHAFAERGAGQIGFFMETAPVQPMLIAMGTSLVGGPLAELMGQLDHMGVLLALSIDGLLPEEEGGTVTLKPDGRPSVAYPVGAALVESMKEGHKRLAELHLAAGAQAVYTNHAAQAPIRSQADLASLDSASYGSFQHGIFTAHQMGGCAMGADPTTSVVNSRHQHHHVENLFVVDGSVLPTALGVNPSETIYGLAHRARAFVADAV